jgi:hypothetical protein
MKNAYNHPLVGQQVVVRAYNAGVHFGELVSADDHFAVLKDSHRIWQWEGAFTLSEVSHDGITGGRISRSVDTMTIPMGDIGEISNLRPEARESILKHLEKKA